MKKLLVLALVLGLSSVSSAVVSLVVPAGDINVGDTITVIVASDTEAANYGAWLDLGLQGLGTWSDLTILPAAGVDASKVYWGDDGTGDWWELGAASFTPTAPVLAGDHFTIDFTATAEGQQVVALWDYNLTESTEARINIVPEPMTLGLLGLGGLFLRRRK